MRLHILRRAGRCALVPRARHVSASAKTAGGEAGVGPHRGVAQTQAPPHRRAALTFQAWLIQPGHPVGCGREHDEPADVADGGR